MISLYSGTPGSGKSYHATYEILRKLNKKNRNNVISNYMLSLPGTIKGKFLYKDNPELTTDFLRDYAIKNHHVGVEGQTLVVVDEAQILFNSRDWQSNAVNRMDWIKFFSQHRHYGFDFILIAQFDRMLDRQIRCLLEYEISHMKVNNFFWFLPFSMFLVVQRWYSQKMKLDSFMIPYRKKIAKCYNSYVIFDEMGTVQGGGAPLGGFPPEMEPAIIETPINNKKVVKKKKWTLFGDDSIIYHKYAIHFLVVFGLFITLFVYNYV